MGLSVQKEIDSQTLTDFSSRTYFGPPYLCVGFVWKDTKCQNTIEHTQHTYFSGGNYTEWYLRKGTSGTRQLYYDGRALGAPRDGGNRPAY